MQDAGELAGHGDGGLLGADPLGQPGAPGFQGGPFCNPVQDDPGCLEQVGAQQRVAVLGDMVGVVVLAGLKAPRRQTDIGTDTGRLRKTLGHHCGPDP